MTGESFSMVCDFKLLICKIFFKQAPSVFNNSRFLFTWNCKMLTDRLKKLTKITVRWLRNASNKWILYEETKSGSHWLNFIGCERATMLVLCIQQRASCSWLPLVSLLRSNELVYVLHGRSSVSAVAHCSVTYLHWLTTLFNIYRWILTTNSRY